MWSVGLLILLMAVGKQNHNKFVSKLYLGAPPNLVNQEFVASELTSIFDVYLVPEYIETTIRGLLTVDSSMRVSANLALKSLSRL